MPGGHQWNSGTGLIRCRPRRAPRRPRRFASPAKGLAPELPFEVKGPRRRPGTRQPEGASNWILPARTTRPPSRSRKSISDLNRTAVCPPTPPQALRLAEPSRFRALSYRAGLSAAALRGSGGRLNSGIPRRHGLLERTAERPGPSPLGGPRRAARRDPVLDRKNLQLASTLERPREAHPWVELAFADRNPAFAA